MKIIILIIMILIVENILTCLYCMMKKKRDYDKCHCSINHRKQEENLQQTLLVAHEDGELDTITQRIKKCILLWLESYIRLKLFILGWIPSHRIRKCWLKNIYRMDIGKRVVIYSGFEIRSPWNIEIGDGTIIGDGSKLDGRYGLYIGRDVNLSTGVWIWTNQHSVNDPMFRDLGEGGSVSIGDRAWISSRTNILPKITIGEGAVVAGGAVVTKDCMDYTIYGGVPAKKIGERNRNLNYHFNGEHLHFL